MFTSPDKAVWVTCRSICPRPLEEQVEIVAAAGVGRMILREKDLPEYEYALLAERVLERCEKAGMDCILHYYPGAARSLGVKKLHMPFGLLTEALCREFETVGCSVHSAEQALAAEKTGASYVTAGHVFATDCKKGLPPRGLDFLSEVCRTVGIPVYAIGGINADNMRLALEAGAERVCMMGFLNRL